MRSEPATKKSPWYGYNMLGKPATGTCMLVAWKMVTILCLQRSYIYYWNYHIKLSTGATLDDCYFGLKYNQAVMEREVRTEDFITWAVPWKVLKEDAGGNSGSVKWPWRRHAEWVPSSEKMEEGKEKMECRTCENVVQLQGRKKLWSEQSTGRMLVISTIIMKKLEWLGWSTSLGALPEALIATKKPFNALPARPEKVSAWLRGFN